MSTSWKAAFRQARINNVDAVDMLAARLAAAGLESGAGPRIYHGHELMTGSSSSSDSDIYHYIIFST